MLLLLRHRGSVFLDVVPDVKTIRPTLKHNEFCKLVIIFMFCRNIITLLIALGLLLSSTNAQQQQQQQQQEQDPTKNQETEEESISLDTNLVVVNVTITDNKDRYVSGLKAADFS